jgi:hypothetical protein
LPPEQSEPAAYSLARFVPVESLIPYARNARTHDDAQIAQLAASMVEWGWTNPVLADEQGIVAGHGRVLAARLLYQQGKAIKLPNGAPVPGGHVPVIDCTGWTEAKRRAYIIADNSLALNAGWDHDILAVELDELRDAQFDVSLLGISQQEMNDLIGSPDDPPEPYTCKVEAPIYEPSGENPSASELYDRTKTLSLLRSIDASEMPDDIKQFLRIAAERHTVLDFRKVADFYANASAALQELMEQSALVIIDFDRAIEDGYVKLSAEIADQFAKDKPEVIEYEDDDAP